jgi:hypothetical protein
MTHRSGDRIRFRVYDLNNQGVGRVHLAFDDPARNFEIVRPERRTATVPSPTNTTIMVAAPGPASAAPKALAETTTPAPVLESTPAASPAPLAAARRLASAAAAAASQAVPDSLSPVAPTGAFVDVPTIASRH